MGSFACYATKKIIATPKAATVGTIPDSFIIGRLDFVRRRRGEPRAVQGTAELRATSVLASPVASQPAPAEPFVCISEWEYCAVQGTNCGLRSADGFCDAILSKSGITRTGTELLEIFYADIFSPQRSQAEFSVNSKKPGVFLSRHKFLPKDSRFLYYIPADN